MSVTIIQHPGTHTPAYNLQQFRASSTNYAQTNFKYVVTVTIDGETVTEKIAPRPDNGQLYFNPQRIVESYVQNKFTDTDELTVPYFGDECIKYVRVDIDEEYGSTASSFVGASSYYYAWNGAYNTRDFEGYFYAAGTYAKDLTLAPSLTDTIHYNQKLLHKMWHRGFGGGDLKYLNVYSYDSAGNNIQIAVLETQYHSPGTSYEYYLALCNCSPRGLNLMKTNLPGANVSLSVPASDVVPSNTAQYIYYWTDATFTQRSNNYTVNINDFCSIYDRYVLHFLNRLGNYDSFTFQRLSKESSEKSISSYKKLPVHELTASSVWYKNHEADEVIYSTEITNKIVLNSDWLTDAQSTWLQDLVNSPSVILENSSGETFAVKVNQKNYELKKKVNDQCYSLTIELEYSYQDIRQRG